MTEEDLAMALKEALDLLDDTEVPTPIEIETEEARYWWAKYVYWRWIKGPYF